jgi:hypothetical protein
LRKSISSGCFVDAPSRVLQPQNPHTDRHTLQAVAFSACYAFLYSLVYCVRHTIFHVVSWTCPDVRILSGISYSESEAFPLLQVYCVPTTFSGLPWQAIPGYPSRQRQLTREHFICSVLSLLFISLRLHNAAVQRSVAVCFERSSSGSYTP